VNSPIVLDAMILIYLEPLEQEGVLQLASICDDELPAYLEVIGMAKGLGEETEGLTLARCRGWRFVTTDKRALQFAAKAMPGHRS